MKSIRLLDRRAGYSLASIGLLLGMVAPAVMPTFASAAILSSRSITLSNSAVSATGVAYDVKFTGTADIDATTSAEGGVMIDFCSESPLLETTCTTPSGLSTASVGTGTVKYAGSNASSNGTVTGSGGHVKWVAGANYTGGQTFELPLTGIVNPSGVGSFYARITTYNNKTALDSYSSATDVGTFDDDGGIALSATNSVGVTAYVLESMTFCVSKGNMGDSTDLTAVSTQAAPSINCGSGETDCNPSGGVDDGCVVAPSMTIGQQNGTVNALDATHLSTGGVYAQLSTNASSGAVVNLKSDATSCGGLYRNGNTANCNIAPKAAAGSFTAGQAFFGLTVGSASAAPLVNGGAGSGTGTITTGTGYGSSDYFIDYVAGNATGVTSTYGSEIFHSTAPVNNMNVPVTFGASISPTTPAGVYGATLNMIATGTY